MRHRPPDYILAVTLVAAFFGCNYGDDDDGVDFHDCFEGTGGENTVDAEQGDYEEFCSSQMACELVACPNAGVPPGGLLPTHAAHVYTEEVVLWADRFDQRVKPASTTVDWAPLSNLDCTPFDTGSYSDRFFCAGHTQLADGRLFVAGGGGGSPGDAIALAGIFDPVAQTWTDVPAMNVSRWYPTLITLANGDILAAGGAPHPPELCVSSLCTGSGKDCMDDSECTPVCQSGTCSHNENPCPTGNECENPAVLTRSTDIYNLSTRVWTAIDDSPMLITDHYPNLFVLPDENVVFAGAEENAQYNAYVLNTAVSPPEWFPATDPTGDDYEGVSTNTNIGGSSVMYEPGKIMRAGGTARPRRTTEVIDLTGDYVDNGADWVTVGDMCDRRHFHSMVLLADGTVLAAGGNRNGNSPAGLGWADANASCDANGTECDEDDDCDALWPVAGANEGRCALSGGVGWDDGVCRSGNNACFAVNTIEIWDPEDKGWHKAVDPTSGDELELQVERMYHHTSLLMRDGKVVITGGGNRSGLVNHHSREIITPPYLMGNPTRPTIALPNEQAFAYGECGDSFITIDVSDATPARVTLLRLGSVTHQFDMSQRFIELCDGPDLGDCAYQESEGRIEVRAPCSESDRHTPGGIAPPGHYMLYVLSDQGVPSEAAYVQVGGTAAYQKWDCNPSAGLLAQRTACRSDPTSGCPAPDIEVTQLNPPAGGWSVVTYPGEIGDPGNPTTSELNLVNSRCVEACQLEWETRSAESENCLAAGVFDAPTYDSVGTSPPLDFVDNDEDSGEGLFAQALSCVIGVDCCEEFDEDICTARTTRRSERGEPLGLEPEYRYTLDSPRGHFQVTTNAGVETTTMTGNVEFSFCDDGNDARCPFYVADLSMSAANSLNVDIDINGSTITKTVSNLTVRLVQPAFGMADGTPTNDIAFPVGSVFLETEFDVDGEHFEFSQPNAEAIYGNETSTGGLDIQGDVSLALNIDGDSVLVTAEFVARTNTLEESPPSVTIDVPSSVTCNQSFSLAYTASDADSDLSGVEWWVGSDRLADTTTSLSIAGTRTLRIVATDARGAATTAEKTIACT